MTADELKRMAHSLLPMPEGLNGAEQAYYTTPRNLYFAYSMERITLEQAKKESVMARKQYEGWVAAKKLSDHTAKMWLQIESVGERYAKEHTLEAADEFFRTVYNLEKSWRE